MFVVGGILRAIFGRFLGAGIVAAIAGFIAWTIGGALLIGIIVAIVAFIFSLFGGTRGGGWLCGWWSAVAAVDSAWRRRFQWWWRQFGWRWRRWEAGDMSLKRIVKHLFAPHWIVARAFPRRTLDAIENAIRASEKSHDGEIAFRGRGGPASIAVLRGQTRAPARNRSVFAVCACGTPSTTAAC